MVLASILNSFATSGLYSAPQGHQTSELRQYVEPTSDHLIHIPEELRESFLTKLEALSSSRFITLSQSTDLRYTDELQQTIKDLKDSFIEQGGTENDFFLLVDHQNVITNTKNDQPGYKPLTALLPSQICIEEGDEMKQMRTEQAAKEAARAAAIADAKIHPQYTDLLKELNRIQNSKASTTLDFDEASKMAHNLELSTEIRRLLDFHTVGSKAWLSPETCNDIIREFDNTTREANDICRAEQSNSDFKGAFQPRIPTQFYIQRQNAQTWGENPWSEKPTGQIPQTVG